MEAAGEGGKIGTATLHEVQGGVRIDLDVAQLPPSIHALHVHAVGKCEGPDFKSAGPHFNPEGKKHGTQNPEGPHAESWNRQSIPGSIRGLYPNVRDRE